MDDFDTKKRAGLAFLMAVICLGLAGFVISYTVGGGDTEAPAADESPVDMVE